MNDNDNNVTPISAAKDSRSKLTEALMDSHSACTPVKAQLRGAEALTEKTLRTI